jgi:pyrophosphatase PpaX
VRAVLFDLDGTLVDTIGLILASFRHATEVVLGQAVADDLLLAGIGTPLAKQMSSFSEQHAEELVRVYREHNLSVHDALAAEFPGVADVLRELKDDGYPIGIVTSKLSAMAWRGLRLFGLDEYIDVMVGVDDVELHKPDPYPLVHAAGLLGVPLSECAYVGDSPHDMEAAIAGGAIAIAALWGPFDREVVMRPAPHYALDSIAGLPVLLQAIGRPDVTGSE